MNTMHQQTGFKNASAILAFFLCGCDLVETIRGNTETIQDSSETIANNTLAVSSSTKIFEDLSPSFERIAGLEEPMKRLGALGPTFEKVADLQTSLSDVAGLKDQLVDVAKLEPALRDVAGLEEPMRSLAKLASFGNLIALAAGLAIVVFFAVLGGVYLSRRTAPASEDYRGRGSRKR